MQMLYFDINRILVVAVAGDYSMMRFDRFTERAQESAQRAAEIIQRYGHNQIDTEHILLALIEQPGGTIPLVLENLAVSPEALTERLDATLRASPKGNIFGGGAGQIFITPRVKRIIDLANEEANGLKDEYISTEHLFLSILTERNTPAARILETAGVTRDKVYTAIQNIRGGQRITDPRGESRFQILEKYSRNLTDLAEGSNLDPVWGRDSEIAEIIQILSRRRRNNPLIVGNDGIGKTSIVHALAQKVVNKSVPQIIADRKIVELDFHLLMAGTSYRGQLEERVTDIVNEINASRGELILFLDDLNEYIAKEASTIFNMLQSALARSKLQLIGTTTVKGYEEFHKRDASSSRLFAPLFVSEMSVEQTILALQTLRNVYEEHHHITISDEAIDTAVRLTDRFIKDRFQPEKSIQLIDDAAATLHLLQFELPPDLQSERIKIEKLRIEEENAAVSRDYQKASEMEKQRVKLENALDKKIQKWQKDQGIPDKLTKDNILDMLSRSIDVPVERLAKEETSLSDFVKSVKVSQDASTEDLQLGDQFKQKYEVVGLLGRGGFGEVWKVRNRELDRFEAIKVLPLGVAPTRKLAERFRNEAKMAANLRHPNIVTIYDTGEYSGRRYISMEYIDGPSLAEVIDQKGKLSLDDVYNIAIQICEALEYAHAHRVVHQDIKPSNILLDGNQIKVADFGISVLVKETMTELTGMGGGTPSYRSPEQIKGWASDPRSDIYSVGITFYELLTGERPFRGASVEFQHLNEEPLPPNIINWEIPPSVDEIVLKCLKKEIIERYQTATELRSAWLALPEYVPLTPIANLLKARLESGEAPYTLVLGESASINSGCSPIIQIVQSISSNATRGFAKFSPWDNKVNYYFDFLQNLSPTERYTILKKYYENLTPSNGYISLAKLIKSGYFELILTTNIDTMLEDALRTQEFADFQVIIIDEEMTTGKLEAILKTRTPKVKIIKLHGDIHARRFAFTPREILTNVNVVEKLLSQILVGDTIIVGHSSRDEDLTRCIGTDGGSLWYVNPSKISMEQLKPRIPRLAKSQHQIISGDNGYFNRFFMLLHNELIQTINT